MTILDVWMKRAVQGEICKRLGHELADYDESWCYCRACGVHGLRSWLESGHIEAERRKDVEDERREIAKETV